MQRRGPTIKSRSRDASTTDGEYDQKDQIRLRKKRLGRSEDADMEEKMKRQIRFARENLTTE